jgi:hypothetical protein
VETAQLAGEWLGRVAGADVNRASPEVRVRRRAGRGSSWFIRMNQVCRGAALRLFEEAFTPRPLGFLPPGRNTSLSL